MANMPHLISNFLTCICVWIIHVHIYSYKKFGSCISFYRLKMVPSFREFLEWLLKQPPNFDDDHWSQYYTHCAVCDTSYNFILKLDEYTFGEVNYVLSKLKLDKSKVYLPRLQRTRAGITNFDITCKYFHNLTTDMILRLYERYKADFEMYNYKIDKYLPCAKRKN